MSERTISPYQAATWQIKTSTGRNLSAIDWLHWYADTIAAPEYQSTLHNVADCFGATKLAYDDATKLKKPWLMS